MKVTLRFPIKGLFYYSAEQLFDLHLISKGRHLQLVLEPQNGFDKNAIQVWLKLPQQEFLVGYIPRQLAKIFRQQLSGEQITALSNRISWHLQQGKWMEIELRIETVLSWHASIRATLFAIWLRQKHQWHRFKNPKPG
ncbi:MAG: HIRAN domain-containing protein [Thiotrichales bacterium]|nr:HIRAN domain-containing protein [Thiotrichales bacterium]